MVRVRYTLTLGSPQQVGIGLRKQVQRPVPVFHKTIYNQGLVSLCKAGEIAGHYAALNREL